MNNEENREERILRIMWEQYVTREQAERVADAEIRFEARRARALLSLVQAGGGAA